MPSKPTCSIPECNKPHAARGWCSAHYYNWQKYGNPYPRRPWGGIARPVHERVWARVDIRDGCWNWQGQGVRYGVIGIDYRVSKAVLMAHRVVYEAVVGPIPEGLTLDHLCFNTFCVRPDHLEPVPISVNVLRGYGPPALNARKTHCKRGHVLPPQRRRGGRECLACVRLVRKAKRERG